MKTIYLIIIFIFAANIFAQDKYFIYFKDKGISESVLLKSSSQYQASEKKISKRAIERRMKIMGKDNYITFEDVPIKEDYVQAIQNLGIKIVHKLNWFNAVSVYLSNDDFKKLSALPFIKKIEHVKSYTFDNEALYFKQGNENHSGIYKTDHQLNYGASLTQLEFSDIPIVQDLGVNGTGILMGILDTGFDWKNHRAFNGVKVTAEFDFVNNDSVTANQPGDRPDQHNHGTYVFSLLAGFVPDTLIGAAYNADFLLAKTEDVRSETHVEEDNYAAALEWMENLGVDITSSSLGYNEFDAGQTSYTYQDMNGETTIVTRAENLANQRGVITVTSAGNEGNTPWFYIIAPADAFNTISVGAANSDNTIASFSSRGPTSDNRIKPEVVALGTSVYGADAFSGGFKFAAGTSSSAPLLAGVTGLLLSAYPHLTITQVRKIILESGDTASDPDNVRGYGRASAKRAISFPNLSEEMNEFKLHKIFLNENGIVPSTTAIFYKVDDDSFVSGSLTYDGSLKYTHIFSGFNAGDTIQFYYTFNDSLGNSIRDPSDNNYKFIFGSLDVSLLTKLDSESTVPDDFTLFQNFPNPFNNQTSIRFFSLSRTNAELIIYNTLGQRVADLFKGEAVKGMNEINWNGRNNFGRIVSSGVYLYVLNINGSIFTKKLVLLK